MKNIKILTGVLEVTGVEEFNNAYERFRKETKNMAYAVWWEGNELLKNITTKFIQDPNIKNIEKVCFNDGDHLFIFEKNNNYYISKRLSGERGKKKTVLFQSDGRYYKELEAGTIYDVSTKSCVLILDELLINKSFNNYKEFIKEVSKIKIEAKEEVEGRESHYEHVNLIYDLNTGEYPKLGKLTIKVNDAVRIYFENVLLFEGYYNSDYHDAEYRWLHKGKFQQDVFKLLEKEKQRRKNIKIKQKVLEEKLIEETLLRY